MLRFREPSRRGAQLMFLIVITALIGAAVTIAVGTALCCLATGIMLSPFGGSFLALVMSLTLWP